MRDLQYAFDFLSNLPKFSVAPRGSDQAESVPPTLTPDSAEETLFWGVFGVKLDGNPDDVTIDLAWLSDGG